MPDDEPYRNAGSPYLDKPKRELYEAALDIAVKALRKIAIAGSRIAYPHQTAQDALDKIAALVPEAVK